MAEQTPAEKAEQFESIGGQVAKGIVDFIVKSNAGEFVLTNGTDVASKILEILFGLTVPIGKGLAKAIANAEDAVAPDLAGLLADAVGDSFGVDIPASTFAQKHNRVGRNQAATALGDGILRTIKGAGGALEPSDEAAKRYLTMVLNMSLEGWYQGFFFEFMSSLVPYVDIGKLESFADLDDTLARTLGLGRITRSVLRPIVDATVVTPLRWQTNKQYRPELLSPSEVARQVARGEWSKEKGDEELARQGYRDDRIKAIYNAARKFHSVSDLDLMVRAKMSSRADALKHLRDQGYDEATAEAEFALERAKRIATFERQLADAAVRAFVDRHIDESELGAMATGATIEQQEKAQLVELAIARRSLNIKRLSLGTVEGMVKSGVLSMSDYRQTAEREGYPPEDVIALELQLRYELDKARTVEEHRRQQEAERAAEKAKRDAERERRRLEVEAERAQQRRGSLAALERAYVRGLIPLERYAEVLVFDYDGDTVGILVSLAQEARLAYIQQQERRELAVKRAERRPITLGDVEQAVLEGVLTLDDYAARARGAGIDAADVAILTATLRERLEDRAEAQRQRDAAGKTATARRIDLARFEQLVRRGRRSLGEYEQLLGELGFDAGSSAAMRELLELTMADDERARRAREAADAKLRERGLSLEQFRRAVVLGLKTVEQYQSFIAAEGFTADVLQLLVTEARNDVAEAEAARQRRDAGGAPDAGGALPLSVVARAARLGVVTLDAYEQRLFAAGMSEDDVAIQLELLAFEIAEADAAKRRRELAEAEAQARGLSLADVERAVKLGVASTEQYRAAVRAAGFDADAENTLMYVLFEELAQVDEARRRREQIALEQQSRGLSISQLEETVRGGLKSLEQYFADVQGLGYGMDDAELLTALLAGELEAKAAKG